MTACRDVTGIDNDGGMDICLQAECEPLTRANFHTGEINTEAEMRSWKFGAVAYKSSNRYFTDSDTKGYSYEWKQKYEAWAPYGSVKKWPDSTTPLSFYAYFPLVDCGVTIAQNDNGDVLTLHDWPDGFDVLYAIATNRTPEPVTTLTFRHAFSKIEAVNFKIPTTSNLTFHIKEIEFTNTHSETNGNIIVRKTGAVYTGGTVQKNRKVTLNTEEKVNKERVQAASGSDGYITLVKSTDNAFFFPVSDPNDIWDSSPSDDFTLSKTCLHLKAKVKQGEEVILQGSGEYVIGSETQYGDIYIPLRGAANQGQQLLAGHKYTINVYLKQGVGYNKDGKVYQPIDLDVSVDEWVENEVTVGQVTVANDNIVLNEGNYWAASIVINAGHKDLSKIAVTPSDNLTAGTGTDSKGELIVTIGKKDGATAGSGSVIVTDHETNSMATIIVTIE